jgi:uncharacterized protein
MEYHEINPEGGRPEPASARLAAPLIASPWTLGLMSLGAVAFILGARWAGWYGRPGTTILLFPFILLMGGLLGLLAGLWAFRTRDALATVVLSVWGSFFLSYGLLNWLVAAGTLPLISYRELGIVLFTLTAITGVGAWAAVPHNRALMVTLTLFALAALFLGIGMQAERLGWLAFGGFILLLAGLAAFYTASALLVESSYAKEILPLGFGRFGMPRVSRVERPRFEGEQPGGAAPAQA